MADIKISLNERSIGLSESEQELLDEKNELPTQQQIKMLVQAFHEKRISGYNVSLEKNNNGENMYRSSEET